MIRPEDVVIKFIRGSGPGGQKKNKVETGVRLTYKGIVVEATEERSQSQNREVAFRRLEEKLASLAADQQAKEKAEAHRNKPKATFGNFRRTYRFVHPAGVTDHETGWIDQDIWSVLDGNIDEFLK